MLAPAARPPLMPKPRPALPELAPDDILRALRPRPLSLRQLLKAMALHSGQRQDLTRHLHRLVQAGTVVRVTGGLLAAAEPAGLVTGRVVQTQPDYAFVVTETEGEADLYVAAEHLGGALPDDTVAVRIMAGGRTGKAGRRQAMVVRVLKRGRDRLVGTYRRQRLYGEVVPDTLPGAAPFVVPEGASLNAKVGDKVVAAITAWPEGYVPGRAEVREVLGPPDRPGADIELVIRKFDLPHTWSAVALEQAERAAREPGPAELTDRRDLRALPIVTIDGEDARDFDDAVYCEDRDGGGWRLGVHIADVSHYLREGTQLDLEARARGTSVYFPERALHMLPEALSTGVCSLKPGRDRLTVSAVMDVEPDGTVSRAECFRSVIHSAARLTYTQVQAVLDALAARPGGVPPLPAFGEAKPGRRHAAPAAGAADPAAALVPELTRLAAVARALRADRDRRGSLDFEVPEPQIILDASGRVQTIKRRQVWESHKLIEDCMIAANEAVARYLAKTDTPTLYRVHDVPAGEKLEELRLYLEAYGYRLPQVSPRYASRAYQQLLRSWRGKPEEPALNLVLLRSMKLAVYQPRNLGHFGLGSKCYTHFTSPIRRYPDLIVHRMLTARLAGPVSGQRHEELRAAMPLWGEQLSLCERRAEKAEREVVALKQAELMSRMLGDVFPGVISGVAPFGFFVEIDDPFVEGLVKVGSLEDDYYRFDERLRSWTGERHGRRFRTGDHVQVQVVRVLREEGKVDLRLYETRPRARADHQRRPARWVKGGRKRRW
jgi:ribonuclease R